MKKARGYVFSRSFYSQTVPQHVQNIVIRDFCKNNNLQYLLSATEYAIKNSYLILENVINKLDEIDGVVFYSLFQLPTDQKKRKHIYKKFITESKSLYFAVENFSITKKEDFEKIENILKIHKLLPKTLELKDLKKYY